MFFWTKNFLLNSVVNDFALAIFPNKLKLTSETNALDKIQCKSRTERHKTCLKIKNKWS